MCSVFSSVQDDGAHGLCVGCDGALMASMNIAYNMLLVIVLNYLSWRSLENGESSSSSLVGPKPIMGFHEFLGLSI